MWSRAVLLFAVVGCNDASPPAARPDPWAGSAASHAAGSADPWSASPSAPTAAPPAPSPSAGGVDTARIDGTWTCSFQATVWQNGMLMPMPGPMPGFSIASGAYTSADQTGTVDFDGSYVSFHGAGYDGWRAAVSSHQDNSRYLVFSGDNHRDAKPGDGARNGDVKCELRP